MDSRQSHGILNQLGIILGFMELLLEATPATDPRRVDMLEVFRAAQTCAAMVQAGGAETQHETDAADGDEV